ncbi:MAG: type II toxin-antitoxin system HicA family toxin [Acetobacteraceae bacterium]
MPLAANRGRGRQASNLGGILGATSRLPLPSREGIRGRPQRLTARRGWVLHIAEGGRHTKVTLNGRQTVVPRHAVDLPPGTLRAIMRQLGVSDRDMEV